MKRTVFVVGAGASLDFGLPLGSDLVTQVRTQIEGEMASAPEMGPIFLAAMQSQLHGDYGLAAQDLAGGLVAARSIDRLLDSRKDRPLVVELGKCGIAAIISQSEASSVIGVKPTDDWQAIQSALVGSNNTWLSRLFSLLQEGVKPADAANAFSECSFITFNYDRCIEHYLRLAFRHVLDQSEASTEEILASIPLVHVYGYLGPIPDSRGVGIPFGPDMALIRAGAGGIRTFTEGAEDGTLDEIEKLIDQAEVIVFLGFAFDPVNVSALFRRPLRENQSMIGTSWGVSPVEISHLNQVAFAGGGLRANLYEAWTCPNLISSTDFRARIEA